MNNEIFEKVKGVLVEQFGDDAQAVNEKTVAADVRGWDSFAHVQLLGKLEKAFGVKFSFKEIMSFSCVGAIVDCLDKKTQA